MILEKNVDTKLRHPKTGVGLHSTKMISKFLPTFCCQMRARNNLAETIPITKAIGARFQAKDLECYY